MERKKKKKKKKEEKYTQINKKHQTGNIWAYMYDGEIAPLITFTF